MPATRKPKPVIGWREWVELPDLAASPIKVKVDTGARTSALHAFRLRVGERDGLPVASFEVHPHQNGAADATRITYPVTGFRKVRSSNGKTEVRPYISTTVRLGSFEWPIELSLTSRDEMGFRMLLGRSAISRRFVVDPGRSYVLTSRSKKEKPRS